MQVLDYLPVFAHVGCPTEITGRGKVVTACLGSRDQAASLTHWHPKYQGTEQSVLEMYRVKMFVFRRTQPAHHSSGIKNANRECHTYLIPDPKSHNTPHPAVFNAMFSDVLNLFFFVVLFESDGDTWLTDLNSHICASAFNLPLGFSWPRDTDCDTKLIAGLGPNKLYRWASKAARCHLLLNTQTSQAVQLKSTIMLL